MLNLKKIMESSYVIKQEKSFKKELRNIYEYIDDELKQKKSAIKLINLISDKIRILEVFPFAFELYKKEEKFEYRKFIVKDYIIIYKINLKERKIKILHIYNQKFNYNKKSILL